MPNLEWLTIHPEVQEAIQHHHPVVALESTLIAHGLPWPTNLETALASEKVVRELGAFPATIAVWEGKPTIGLTSTQIEQLAQRKGVWKASRRDLSLAIAQQKTAATTVAGTMYLAHQSGISIFATGGIGGVHRGAGESFDISADLIELARTPVLVVCAGAKNILDLPKTLELLETLSVPVIGYRTNQFPAFYLRASGYSLSHRVDSPEEMAQVLRIHHQLEGGGMLLTQPVSESVALEEDRFQEYLHLAETEAQTNGVQGAALTPYLLSRLADLTNGDSLRANQHLIVENARLAAQVAVAYHRDGG